MAMRPEKNSERVEVRLPYSLKQRFLSACERAGETPSEALRDAMADYILRIEQAGKPNLFEGMTMRLIHNPLKAAGMTLASLTAFALMAAPSSADERLFKALDLDGDGAISAEDLSETDRILIKVLDSDFSDTVTLDEFRLITRFGRITITGSIGSIAVGTNSVTVNEHQSGTVIDGQIELEEPQTEGVELILPDEETWLAAALVAEHDDATEGNANVGLGNHHANVVTLDLSQAGQVRLTSERVDWDDFDPESLGLVIVDGVDDEAETP